MEHKILIVEDDTSLNYLISSRLTSDGYHCESAHDGETAINLINSQNFTLVLLDYKLPDFNAKEIISHFIEQNKKVNFVVVTGQGDEKIAVEIMKLGAIDYLIKDTRLLDVLPTIISKILKQLKLQNDLKIANKKIIESELLYKQLVKQLPDIIIIHRDGKILFVNEALFNYLPNEKFEGKTLISLFSQSSGKNVLQNLQKLKIDKNLTVHEINIVDKNNLRNYFQIKSESIEYKGNSAILTVLTDITKIKQSEEKIVKATIETQEKERSRIAEDLHDDLGPILSSIKIYSDLLLSTTKTAEEKIEFSKKIQELTNMAVNNTRTIANNLMPNTLKDFGLLQAIEMFCETINKAEIIKIEFTSNSTSKIDKTNEIVIYRVITELINNSIKHSNCKNIQLNISIGENLNIFYKDDGCGISSKKNDKGMGMNNIINRLKSINATFTLLNENGFGIKINKEIK